MTDRPVDDNEFFSTSEQTGFRSLWWSLMNCKCQPRERRNQYTKAIVIGFFIVYTLNVLRLFVSSTANDWIEIEALP